MKKIRIGAGAGYAGDRIEPAVELIKEGNLDYIMFECLAERTIAINQQEKQKDPTKGYNNLLESRMRAILPYVKDNEVKVITNMGSANPEQGTLETIEIAKELGISNLKVATVTGDDTYYDIKKYYDRDILELDKKLSELDGRILSANTYIGSEGIVKALEDGADIIITGRVADPALTLGPLFYEFGWTLENNADQVGQGVLAGHLLECGGQITGGYYADPGHKDVPGLEKLGFPIAEISEDGSLIITKVEGSGGKVTPDTCKEQMLYEIHDPSKYLTPDATADFSSVIFEQVGKDRVRAANATSHGRPDTLKVSIGYDDGFIGEGQISYGGSNCVARAELAKEIVLKRLGIVGAKLDEVRTDLIGFNSLYKDKISKELTNNQFSEIRLRVTGRSNDQSNVTHIGNEVEALYTNGPAGGGGVSKSSSAVVSVCSIFINREDVNISVSHEEL
jgi:hypothetical protein